MTYTQTFCLALAETCILEGSAALILARCLFPNHARIAFPLAAVVSTVITLPAFWLVVPRYFRGAAVVPCCELGIMIMEALVYWRICRISFRESLHCSAIANSLSWAWGYL